VTTSGTDEFNLTRQRANGSDDRVANAALSDLSELHLLVLGRIAHLHGTSEDVASWLGLPVEMVEVVCKELEAHGLIAPALWH
jgi:hypothetical protein